MRARWIAGLALALAACDGASDDAAGTEGTEAPTVIEPGGELDIGDPPCFRTPCEFGTEPPAHVAGKRCSTGQWWQFAGDERDGAWMHPGGACIDCHKNGEGEGPPDETGPLFSYAGTVMGALDDETDCRGIPKVLVEILDADDEVLISRMTNPGGNFYLQPKNLKLEEYRVRLTLDGRTREMTLHQTLSGDCASCHSAEGEGGAPGRIVAP